jgi:hypothetical protein
MKSENGEGNARRTTGLTQSLSFLFSFFWKSKQPLRFVAWFLENEAEMEQGPGNTTALDFQEYLLWKMILCIVVMGHLPGHGKCLFSVEFSF